MTSTPAHDEPLYTQVKHDLGTDPEEIAKRPRWSYAEASKRFEATKSRSRKKPTTAGSR